MFISGERLKTPKIPRESVEVRFYYQDNKILSIYFTWEFRSSGPFKFEYKAHQLSWFDHQLTKVRTILRKISWYLSVLVGRRHAYSKLYLKNFRFAISDHHIVDSQPSNINADWYLQSSKVTCAHFCILHYSCYFFVICNPQLCGIFSRNFVSVQFLDLRTSRGCKTHIFNDTYRTISTSKLDENRSIGHSASSTVLEDITTHTTTPGSGQLAENVSANKIDEIISRIEIEDSQMTYADAIVSCDLMGSSFRLFYNFIWTNDFINALAIKLAENGEISTKLLSIIESLC